MLEVAVFAALAYGLALLLNATIYKRAVAAPWQAWLFAGLVVVATFFGTFFWEVLTRGGGAKPNFMASFVNAALFFVCLKRGTPAGGPDRAQATAEQLRDDAGPKDVAR